MAEETPNPLLSEPEVVEPVGENAPIGVTAAPASRAAAAFIFLTVTLDMLAMGMIVPVLPKLIQGFEGGNAASTATMIGIFGFMFAGIQFVFSPLLGALSDKVGRRPVVLMSNFGLGADYVVMALAPTLPWLFLGRVISGLTSSSVPTAMAYMADVTPHEKRAAAFGMLNAAFGIGFVVGPALGGALGNVADRYRLGMVVDFIHVHWAAFDPFPFVFNIGDSAIVVGVGALLLESVLPASFMGRFRGHTRLQAPPPKA